MAERICPFMSLARFALWDGKPNRELMDIECQGDCCQLWDNGDCGLKVGRGDRHKEPWERLKALLVHGEGVSDTKWIVREMDKIEAKMGGKNE